MLLVLLQSFSKLLLLAEYRLNRAYIARVLCENRQRPKLKCNGKCQLMKKWAAEDKAAAEQGAKLKFEEIPFCGVMELTLPVSIRITTARNGRYARSCTDPDARPLLHPPGSRFV
ncbi:hypothetical protein GCM10028786_04360 [Flaviaesturariibacter terrae]